MVEYRLLSKNNPRVSLLILAMIGAGVVDGAGLEIQDENVESHLVGKKATFMMFYGSKCEECEDIMPEWKRLADEWEGHPYGQIAQIDCEIPETEAICNYFQIQEIPTLVVGGSMEWEFYDGSHDFESLSDFAKKRISKPICSAHVPENCLEEDLAILKPLQAKSTEELLEIYEQAQAKLQELYNKFHKDESAILNARFALTQDMHKLIDETVGEYPFKFVHQVMDKRMQDSIAAERAKQQGSAKHGGSAWGLNTEL